jgi:hypothetical protein
MRRHDLDALRASAMILGIAYHAALSLALNFPWFIQDPSSTSAMNMFASFVHGFRMPLFFVISGFFTAMLWQKRGAGSLVWNRFRRVLLPCIVGCFTLVPLSNWVIGYAMQQGAAFRNSAAQSETADSSIWAAIRKFDSDAVQKQIDDGFDLKAWHPEYRLTALTWTALVGDIASAQAILDRGCDVDIRNEDGGTALHAAAFLGRADVAHLLMERGAELQAKDNNGQTPMGSAQGDLAFVSYIAPLIGIPVELADVKGGRSRILAELESRGASAPPAVSSASGKTAGATQGIAWQSIWQGLIYIPVFSYLWFLWILWWQVVLFAIVQWFLRWLPWKQVNWKWMLSPAAIACMMILTLVPNTFMSTLGTMLGPDTAMGIVPMPHVFAYYALFFFYGSAYYMAKDTSQALGSSWKWMLPVALLILFPIAFELSTGFFGLRNSWLPTSTHRISANVSQTMFAWWMALGCIGLFQSLVPSEKPWIRYMSDSSYWLYIAHFPLVILGQVWVLHLPWPAWLKLAVISLGSTLVLLLSYHYCVRSTWIGWFLNGTRGVKPQGSAEKSQDAVVLPISN